MIDFDKEKFRGSGAIRARREAGVAEKIIGVRTDATLKPGAGICTNHGKVAEVVASCFSHTLNAHVGLALFPRDIAYAGRTFHLGSAQGPEVRTISMPPIMPRSLGVKLDEI
jgi:glycine cleavage system aminomethyltransferase T